MRPARPDQLEAGARQSRVIGDTVQIRLPPRSIARSRLQCERVTVGPQLFDEVYAPSTLGISLRESIFGVLMLVVLTTTARAAPLQGDQPYSPVGSAADTRQKFCISRDPPSE
jgi:hypothetical protein